MNVLVACEESQIVSSAFRSLGITAFSCDLQMCSGGHPEFHVCGDVTPLLHGDCSFYTCDGVSHSVSGSWDLIIAHPPCTFLTSTGNRWFDVDRYGSSALSRITSRDLASDFFLSFTSANTRYLCIENPVGVMSSKFRKPDQIIQPWMFGDPFEKRTCLWLFNLPPLYATNPVTPPPRKFFSSGSSLPSWYADCASLSPAERSRVRSKTFPGIARAMALQWSSYISFNFFS